PEFTATTHYNLTCPACVGKQSRMGRARFSWVGPEAPEQVRCNDCNVVFPNDAYPETGVLELPRMGQAIPYYETPGEREHPEEREKYAFTTASGQPMMTSFSGLARLYRARWAADQALLLSKLYVLTGEIAYVDRCVWILERFVQVYPNYLWRTYRNFFVDLPPAEVAANLGEYEGGGRFAPEAVRHAYLTGIDSETGFAVFDNGFWGGGRLEDHANDYRWLLGSVVAYDLIRDAEDSDGTRLLGEETERRIRDELLVPACVDWEHWGAVHNKGMGYFAISAALGVFLKQPKRVRHALEGFNRMLVQRYQFDGFYTDTPGYGLYNFSQLRPLPDLLLGYSDPPDYQPESGSRIENLNLYEVGQYKLVTDAALRMLAPGNRLPVIADTVYGSTLGVDFVDFLAARFGGMYAGLLESAQGAALSAKGSEYSLWYRSPDLQAPKEPVALPLRSEWFPGWHVGVLRGGREENDTALFLTGHEHRWTLRTGHEHPDILALSFYAYGEELASDRGYYSGDSALAPDRPVGGQYWTKSTASHNLVLVDDKCQSSEAPAGSNLELFGVTPGVEVVQASGFQVYPQCEEYCRTSALVRRTDGQAYVVDFFRVKGGENHKYCFHCNGSMVGMVPDEPAPKPVVLPPPRDDRDYSGWVKNPRTVTPETPYTFSWKSGDVNLELRLLNSQNSVDRILIVDAPGWRHQMPAEEFEKPPIQQVMAEHCSRKEGEVLATGFAAVVVPYQDGVSPVLEVRLLAEDATAGVLAVEVQLEGRTDYIISTRDQEQRQYGPVRAAGEFAFVSVDTNGRATQGYLLKGTHLECGDFRIDSPGASVTLPVRSVSEQTFYLAEPLPDGLAGAGSYVLASGPAGTFSDPDAPPPQTGFEIESVTPDSITVRDYPALDCGEVTVLSSRWLSVSEQ
ncbi:MAG: heparinase II/III family protein, partial [bacterium]|nr:heparinase II/III family protein [bacterium]